MIYLDYASTTPMSDDALYVFNEATKRFFGNSSSLHEIGTIANDALESCRKTWAGMLDCYREGIFFTSGGTESNQLAVQSLVDGNKMKGNHLITTEVEHSSLYNLFKKYEEEGYEVTYLPLGVDGQINLQQLQSSLRPTTILVSIQAVNSETGFIQPIEAIGALLQKRNIPFHTDFVQGFGNLSLSVNHNYIDSLSIASHKIYGPKGVGLCYINPRVNWKGQIPNTTHELGFRPGTVDVPSIMAFTRAAQRLTERREIHRNKMKYLRNTFLELLEKSSIPFTLYESPTVQLPQIIALSIAKLQGQYIMLECNKHNIAISTGSACQVGRQSPSRTLLSLGKGKDEANQLVRISLGKNTTLDEINQLVKVLSNIVKQ